MNTSLTNPMFMPPTNAVSLIIISLFARRELFEMENVHIKYSCWLNVSVQEVRHFFMSFTINIMPFIGEKM
jgi:hypothetical protein